jgi:hypothetical protein
MVLDRAYGKPIMQEASSDITKNELLLSLYDMERRAGL